MSNPTIRLGIIGLGAQGGYYAGFLAKGRVPNVSLAAICDTDEAKRSVAEDYGVPFYTDYVAMLDSGEVDAVVTTIPHYLHPEVAIAALDHGLHVLVEKPIGVYTKQARQLLDHAAATPELTTAVMFNQRTNPLYIDLRELIQSGELGRLRHTSWIITTWWRPQGYYDQSAWRATWGGEGGGVLVNQAPHQLDLWQWLCGVPTSVFAKLGFGFRRDIAVEDEVSAMVDFGGRDRHLHHLHPRPGRHRPAGDPAGRRQDRRGRLQNSYHHPADGPRAGAQRRFGHGRSAGPVHRADRRLEVRQHNDPDLRLALDRPAPRGAAELRGAHSGRYAPGGSRRGRHAWRPARERDPPVGLDG